MTTRIGTGGPTTGVLAATSAARVTAPPGQPFKAVLGSGARAILEGAEQAVTRLPGGPILAAALRPGGGSDGGAAAGASGAGVAASPEGSAGTAESGLTAVSGQGSGIDAAMSEGTNQYMYWIKMQERINAETRDFTAISNVLKARHDTVKNAIGNIR